MLHMVQCVILRVLRIDGLILLPILVSLPHSSTGISSCLSLCIKCSMKHWAIASMLVDIPSKNHYFLANQNFFSGFSSIIIRSNKNVMLTGSVKVIKANWFLAFSVQTTYFYWFIFNFCTINFVCCFDSRFSLRGSIKYSILFYSNNFVSGRNIFYLYSGFPSRRNQISVQVFV